jgi:pimeloyl-ACP methyl ester carboxylesterase
MEDLYDDFIKISFRSKDEVDVNQFSRNHFNGGGHINAAGGKYMKTNEKDTLEGKMNFAKKIALSTKNEGVLAAVKGMIERTDKKLVLENFDGKILVIAGKHDRAINVEKTIENLPDQTNIKSYILDCGHNGHWEKPSICAEIINIELLHHLPKHLLF